MGVLRSNTLLLTFSQRNELFRGEVLKCSVRMAMCCESFGRPKADASNVLPNGYKGGGYVGSEQECFEITTAYHAQKRMQVQGFAQLGLHHSHVPAQKASHARVDLAGKAIQGQISGRRTFVHGPRGIKQQLHGHMHSGMKAFRCSQGIRNDQLSKSR